MDTAGQEEYNSIAKNVLKNANGIILVYSVDDRESFKKIENWYKMAFEIVLEDTPIMLLGNKIDLD